MFNNGNFPERENRVEAPSANVLEIMTGRFNGVINHALSTMESALNPIDAAEVNDSVSPESEDSYVQKAA